MKVCQKGKTFGLPVDKAIVFCYRTFSSKITVTAFCF